MDPNGVLDRWVFDEQSERAVMALLAAGLYHVGTTTYAGHLEELTFFTPGGTMVSVSFRHMLAEHKPVRREVMV